MPSATAMFTQECSPKGLPPSEEIDAQAGVNYNLKKAKPVVKHSKLVTASSMSSPLEPSLPFCGSDDMDEFSVPVKPILKPRFLKDCKFVLLRGQNASHSFSKTC